MTIRSKGVRWHEFAGKSWSTNDYAFLIIFGFSNHFEIAIATAATIYDLGHHAVHATTKGLFLGNSHNAYYYNKFLTET